MLKLGEINLALKYTKLVLQQNYFVEVLIFLFHKGFEEHQVRIVAGVNQRNLIH